MLIWVLVSVAAVWVAISITLALLIGRAAHIGDVKHEDELFLGRVSRDLRIRETVRQP